MANEQKDLERVESATITAVTIIDRQNAYESVTPYRIRHQFTGGTSYYYSSDTGNRTQTGSITVATGHEFHGEVLRALNSSGIEFQDDSATAYLVVNDGGQVDVNTDLLLAGGTQDYLITSRSTNLAIQSQTAATAGKVEFYTADGDETDDCQLFIFAKGTQSQDTDQSFMKLGFDVSDAAMLITSEKNNTATQFPIIARTEGNTNQLYLATDGNVGIGVADPDTTLEVFNAGTQLKLSFDGTDNATFAVDTNGYLAITPSGGNVGVGMVPVAEFDVNGDIRAGNLLAIVPQDADLSADNQLVTLTSSMLHLTRSGGDITLPTERTFGISAGTYDGQVLYILSTSGSMDLDSAVGGGATIQPAAELPLTITTSQIAVLIWDTGNTRWNSGQA